MARMVDFVCRVPPQLHQDMKRLAAKRSHEWHRVSLSEIVRQAMLQFLQDPTIDSNTVWAEGNLQVMCRAAPEIHKAITQIAHTKGIPFARLMRVVLMKFIDQPENQLILERSSNHAQERREPLATYASANEV